MRLLAVVPPLASATVENRELIASLDLFQTSNSRELPPTDIRVKFFGEQNDIWDMAVGKDLKVSGLLIGASPNSVFFKANPTVKFEIRDGKYSSVTPGSEVDCTGEWHEIGLKTEMSVFQVRVLEGRNIDYKMTPLWVQAGSVNDVIANVRLVLVSNGPHRVSSDILEQITGDHINFELAGQPISLAKNSVKSQVEQKGYIEINPALLGFNMDMILSTIGDKEDFGKICVAMRGSHAVSEAIIAPQIRMFEVLEHEGAGEDVNPPIRAEARESLSVQSSNDESNQDKVEPVTRKSRYNPFNWKWEWPSVMRRRWFTRE
jgi:hypothetical protein